MTMNHPVAPAERHRPLQRIVDLAVAAPLALITAPAQAVVAGLVRKKLGSPVLFRQPRPGKAGVPFELLKFRSMRTPDPAAGLVSDADRMTPFGALLRSTSLDELPSLWNVLRGDMSLVGPRPLHVRYLGRYTPAQSRRHTVRPGMTGLAQVCGRNALSWEEKLALDTWYVDHACLRLDLRILARTLSLVVRREGVSAAGEATMTEFFGTTPGAPSTVISSDPLSPRARRAVVTSTIPLTLWALHRELLRQLREAGFEVVVISSPGRHLDLLANDGVRTVALPMARDITPAADARALLAWLRVLHRERPSLVLTATPKASLLGQLAAWATDVPDRCYYLGGLRLEGEQGWRRRVLAAMERLTAAASTQVVANSPSLLDLTRRLHLVAPRKLRVTDPGSSHGVDAEHFAPGPADPVLQSRLGLNPAVPTIVFVGRLTRDKGIDTLIDGLERLRRGGRQAQLLIVGAIDEPDSQRYLRRLRSWVPDVVATGHVEDVRDYLRLAVVHVLPSLREGFPNAVLEASACGLPTVSTDATGCVDSVRDGVTGFIVPVGDSTALADRLGRLLGDPELAVAMGASAREWVTTQFQPAKVVASLLGDLARQTTTANQ